MATNIISNFILSAQTAVHINRLSFSTSTPFMIKWRYKKNIEPNPNRFGPLTNLPDYSFVDGRPVPLGSKLYKKLQLQRKCSKEILDHINEINAAIEENEIAKQKERIYQEKLQQSRLKEKGKNLKIN